MIKPIVRDTFFLSQKAHPADKEDMQVILDLEDTLKANADHCVGMAANMIGVQKSIIIVNAGTTASGKMLNLIMVNPEIVKKSEPYETEEGCLSLSGVRKTTRYKKIEVKYLDRNFKKQKKTYTGYTAQIIQHEVDHCNGILI